MVDFRDFTFKIKVRREERKTYYPEKNLKSSIWLNLAQLALIISALCLYKPCFSKKADTEER